MKLEYLISLLETKSYFIRAKKHFEDKHESNILSKDLQYIKEMVPNVSEEVLQILKTLQPGNAIAFGSAFKVPVSLKMEKPNPQPYSSNSDVAKIWYALN